MPQEQQDPTGRPALPYVLVTPARNEAAYIDLTLRSVVAQSVLPTRWVIVDDGSTDGTADIVRSYVKDHPWIELLSTPPRAERHFGGKAAAFRLAYEHLQQIPFDIVANLDADVSFGPDHFEFLLQRFAADPSLGVAGTAFVENGSVAYNYDFVDVRHVSGQCQLFRRSCYDAIGGYKAIKGGGVDWTAVTTARMLGWGTRTFPERHFVHHRVMGTGMGSVLGAKYRFGRQDYYLGSHPLWELVRGVYQLKSRPYLLGGTMILIGYFWAMARGIDKAVSPELQRFRRAEQFERLRALAARIVPFRRHVS